MSPTHAHPGHPLAPAMRLRMQDAREAGPAAAALLRRAGCRPTPQRLLILQALGGGGHLTADEALDHARAAYPTVNASTVYRTLESLATAGLVRGRTWAAAGPSTSWCASTATTTPCASAAGPSPTSTTRTSRPLADALLAATGYRLTRPARSPSRACAPPAGRPGTGASA